MSRASQSIFTWGILMVLFGAGYLFAPNFFLPIFGLPPTTEMWIRAFALLLALLGGYYLYCAWNNDMIFFASRSLADCFLHWDWPPLLYLAWQNPSCCC
jgi:hypothetical protein